VSGRRPADRFATSPTLLSPVPERDGVTLEPTARSSTRIDAADREAA